MMPNTSVNPAANRNSSSPNCNPFRNCSTTSSMGTSYRIAQRKQRRRERRRCFAQGPRSFHRDFVMEAGLGVLDDGSDRFQRKLALGVLDHILQIEALDRNMVVTVFERAAQRLEIRLLHLGLHGVL